MVLQAKAFVNEAGGSLCRSREMGEKGLVGLGVGSVFANSMCAAIL